jgi:hypothetical protein
MHKNQILTAITVRVDVKVIRQGQTRLIQQLNIQLIR